jgi:dTDP-4-dehydrorhamnose reductase
MKILITGANGLLGQKLVSLLGPKENVNLIATSLGKSRLSSSYKNFSYESLDITNKRDVEEIVGRQLPEVIIHTASMTNVDQCESERNSCLELNVNAIEYIVDACRRHNVFLVHLSTDFIFDGENGPYDEEAQPNPLSIYGKSKLKAEKVLFQSGIDWAIARTILVYGITEGMSRSNIILWVKKNLEEGRKIRVVTDQWRTPTLAEDLAMGCYLLASRKAKGVFNIGGKDMLTPYDMAIKTAHFFNLDTGYISKADSTTFQQPAKRPPKTGLIIEKAQKQLGYQPHSFDEGIAVLASQLNASDY